MNPRGHEAPMDFEWQTSGPADTTSPFYQLAMKHREKQQEGKHGQKRMTQRAPLYRHHSNTNKRLRPYYRDSQRF